jgi:hypothetical protein
MAKSEGLFFPPSTIHVAEGRLEVWNVPSPAQLRTGFHTDYCELTNSSLKSDTCYALVSISSDR